MAELVLKLLGILFGVLARTLVPYLRKLKQGKVKEFKSGYGISAIASFILGLITTLLIFPKFEITQTGPGVALDIKDVKGGFGFAWNSLVNEAAKWTPLDKKNYLTGWTEKKGRVQ